MPVFPTLPRRQLRDVDDAAPFKLVTAEGCLPVAATSAGNLDAAQAASASGLPLWQWLCLVVCHSLLLEASMRPSPSSPSSFCTAES
jgi:hypothetical protein